MRSPRYLWAVLAAGACLVASAAAGQPAALGIAADPNLLRWDPAIRYGVLPNGLRYAVQRNATPKGGVSLRLGINVGSYDETDEERGAAHMIEHLAFDATRSYPTHQLDLIFAPLHVTFARDRNASSDLRQTVYQLDLPSTDSSELDVAGKWLRDVADGLTFTDPAVAQERGALETERAARGADILRALRARMDVFVDGDLRSNARNPLGTPESLKALTAARLAGFYDRWYRPDNAALVMVGDLPLDVLEQKVRATFGDWAARGPAGVRAARSGPATIRGPGVLALTDARLPSIAGMCRITGPDPDASPEERLHTLLLRGLWEAILQERINVTRSRKDAPFAEATISDEMRPDSLKTCVGIIPNPGQEVRALAMIQALLQRFGDEGPTEQELDLGLEAVRGSVRNAIAGGGAASSQRASEVLNRVLDRLARLAPREGLRAFDVLMDDTRPATVKAAFARDWSGWGPLAPLSSPSPCPKRPSAPPWRGRRCPPRGRHEPDLACRRRRGLVVTNAAQATDGPALQRAAAALRAQLQTEPNRPDLHAQLGETLESLGDTAGAMAEYDRAIRGPGDTRRALVDRGRLLVRQGRFDDGRQDFNRALSQNPRDVDALAARGHSWVAQRVGKRAPAALADFTRPRDRSRQQHRPECPRRFLPGPAQARTCPGRPQ